MQRKSFEGMTCSIARSLEEVGEWWSLLIVRECMQGATRFDEFQTELGIARNILTTRLARLTELGILERYPLEDRANTDGYRLTAKGEDLHPVIVALMQWGDRWLAKGSKPPTLVVEDATGRQVDEIGVRVKGGRSLSHHDVRYARGPGATSKTQAVIDRRNARVLGEPTD
ncbi:MAG TPA: helix-turn-helix domain-containing protein [Gemmatimonadaceae bacterium]|jgi:DNA-binding HxlR family transcriptional regulator